MYFQHDVHKQAMINSTAHAKSHLHHCVSKKNKREVHPENPFISDPCKITKRSVVMTAIVNADLHNYISKDVI